VIVEMKQVVKRYNELVALDHFDLEIQKGDVYGLLGPNGSGKSTAIHSMLALLKFEKGEVNLFGEPMKPNRYDLKARVGFVPQEVSVADELTVGENVDYFCGLYIKDKNERKRLVQEAIDFVGLEKFRKFRPQKLSGGLKRRLNIACGIAHKPELIFFDEPTVAVDPQSRNNILEGIKRLNEEGATIIYTTHYMEEVEQLCNTITIMDKGRALITGSNEELKKSVGIGDKVRIQDMSLSAEEQELLRGNRLVQQYDYKEGTLDVMLDKDAKVLHFLNLLSRRR
jgi:ABC-2 type transport system ATP-binding protein